MATSDEAVASSTVTRLTRVATSASRRTRLASLAACWVIAADCVACNCCCNAWFHPTRSTPFALMAEASNVSDVPTEEIDAVVLLNACKFVHVGHAPPDAGICMAWLAPHGAHCAVHIVGEEDPCETVSPPQMMFSTHTASVVAVAAATWYCVLVHCDTSVHTVLSSPIAGTVWNTVEHVAAGSHRPFRTTC